MDHHEPHDSDKHAGLTGPEQVSTVFYRSSFDFPRPALDGSLPELSATSQRCSTPPAALSSLGARLCDQQASMVRNADQGAASLAESQYVLVDDASEFSTEDGYTTDGLTDDADTVSLVSTDHHSSEAEQASLEGSVIDEVRDHTRSPAVPPSPGRANVDIGDFRQLVAQAFHVGDEPADSILSEDLETPRQSTMGTHLTALPALSKKPDVRTRSFNVLFLSNHDTVTYDMDTICTRLASALAGQDGLDLRVVKLPVTPSGTSPNPHTTYLCGDLELTVQHCVDVQARPASFAGEKAFWNFHIVDPSAENAITVKTLRGNLYPALDRFDLAVFFKPTSPSVEPSWFQVARNALVFHHKVPCLAVGDYTDGIFSSAMRQSNPQGIMSFHDYLSRDRNSIHTVLADLLGPQYEKFPVVDIQHKNSRPTSDVRVLPIASSLLTKLLVVFLPLLILLAFQSTGQVANSAAEVAVRRDAVITAYSKMANLSTLEVSSFVKIDHLIPAADEVSRDATSVHCQTIDPNQLLVSFLKGVRDTSYPKSITTTVQRAGQDIRFNQTKLIDGVYHVEFDKDEAYGSLEFYIATHNPPTVYNLTRNYGSKMLQRATYERALSKRVESVRTLQAELAPTFFATKNVTGQLGVRMAQELQQYADTAVGFAKKALSASMKTAERLEKDMSISKDKILEFGKNVQESVAPLTQKLTKESLLRPLIQARKKVLTTKFKFNNRHTSTSYFGKNPISELASDLKHVARCVKAAGIKQIGKCQKQTRTHRAASDAVSAITSGKHLARFYKAQFGAMRSAKSGTDNALPKQGKCSAKRLGSLRKNDPKTSKHNKKDMNAKDGVS